MYDHQGRFSLFMRGTDPRQGAPRARVEGCLKAYVVICSLAFFPNSRAFDVGPRGGAVSAATPSRPLLSAALATTTATRLPRRVYHRPTSLHLTRSRSTPSLQVSQCGTSDDLFCYVRLSPLFRVSLCRWSAVPSTPYLPTRCPFHRLKLLA